ncbi:MAG: phage portal protein [bacterium]
MAIFEFNQKYKSEIETLKNELNDVKKFYSYFNSIPTLSINSIDGVEQTIETDERLAQNLSAFYKGLHLITDTIGSLSANIYKIENGQEVKDVNHPYHNMIHYEPNEQSTSINFYTNMVKRMYLYGNCIILPYTKFGKPQLRFLNRVKYLYSKELDIIKYIDEETGISYDHDEVIHLFTNSENGLIGEPILYYAGSSVGHGLEMQKYASKYFKNNANSSFAIVLDYSNVNETTIETTQDIVFNQIENNNGKPLILPGVGKIERLTVDPEKSELLNSRKFQNEDIANFFKIDSQYFNGNIQNLELSNRLFYQHTLLPVIKVIEQEFTKKLFKGKDKYKYSFKLNIDSLLRADLATRQEFYKFMIEHMMLTPNQILELENKPTFEGGDVRLLQANNLSIVEFENGKPKIVKNE